MCSDQRGLHLFLPLLGSIITIKPLRSGLRRRVRSGQKRAAEPADLSTTKQSLGLSYKSPLTFKHLLEATGKITTQHKPVLWSQGGYPVQKEFYSGAGGGLTHSGGLQWPGSYCITLPTVTPELVSQVLFPGI